MKPLFLLLILFSTHNSFSQLGRTALFSPQQVANANDYNGILLAKNASKIRLNAAPNGPGEEQEIPQKGKNNPYYFDKEHNIVWIQFTTVQKGKLTISIIPDSTNDDYDFLLFERNGTTTLDEIKSGKLKPIRTNLARSKGINSGVTGLEVNAEKEFQSEGKNPTFSRHLEVEEGQTYILVIDNVYDNGGAATIELDYVKVKTINGIVKNDENEAIQAEVKWMKIDSDVPLAKTTTDSSGSYSLEVPYNSDFSQTYTLTVEADDHFFHEQEFSHQEIDEFTPTPLKLVVNKLKKGKKTQLLNINFVGNKASFLPSSGPSLKRLLKLMKKNKTLEIQIVGHTNGCNAGIAVSQRLSEDRAKATADYLIKNGIASNRITTDGKNCQEMIYPMLSSERLQKYNRRVEIIVVKM